MKKTIFYASSESKNMKRAVITTEDGSYGLPTVLIKAEAFGAADLALNGIQLYSYDPAVVELGKKQLYQIKLLTSAIRTAREKSGLTQKELAAKMEVSEQHVQFWEYGSKKPSGANLIRLAKILNVEPEVLL